MRPSTLMKIAHDISGDSKCAHRQVGVVIARNGRIITTGINGTPKGLPNCNETKRSVEEHRQWSPHNEIHAEMNAILFAAKHGVSIDGATMYTTLAPCTDCAKAITQSGIVHVVYDEEYYRSGAELLSAAGITVTKGTHHD